MAKTKKTLSLKEKHLKEITSLRKKIEKWKNTLLQDLSHDEESEEMLINVFNIEDSVYEKLYDYLSNSIFKDEESNLEDEDYELDE